ncbi:DUF7524 family protein [Halorarius litoreus]|uniref:DUF7524 family protein n=1 Tax=Halorarius litoreus TaxID=2962676 RepID=UPI0020CEE862|nr:hypothetical protein [Halorarius litoreus]
MTDTLVAEINRQRLHSLEVPESFETGGSFVVELRNRGESTHVHLHLDDSLSAVARLEANNHYVRAEATRRVRIEVDAPEDTEITGRLKVVTAYGAETRYVTVTVDNTPPNSVQVDPELGKPKPRDEESSPLAGLDPALLGVGLLGIVAVVLAVGAVFAADGLNIILGVLAVLAGIVAAGLLTIR